MGRSKILKYIVHNIYTPIIFVFRKYKSLNIKTLKIKNRLLLGGEGGGGDDTIWRFGSLLRYDNNAYGGRRNRYV